MKKQLPLVTFEQARKLKVLGFYWEVPDFYYLTGTLVRRNEIDNHNHKRFDNECVSAPTVALAFEWIRKNWLLVDWLDFSGEINEYGEPLFYSNYFFGKEPRKTSKEAMPRKKIESKLLDELLTLLEKENKS
jgi:hypothetical protein